MAQRHVLVVDASKFGKVRSACLDPLTSFDTPLTDIRPDEEYLRYAQQHNISLVW